MKKLMIIAAACVALAACNKSELVNGSKVGPYFEKGQKVTLSVSAADTKVTSSYVTAASEKEKDRIEFKWEKGDKIKVTVGTESADFTLKGEGGSESGYFEGEMPASGNTFDVAFPATDTPPSLTTQTYEANALPHNMMYATATGCTIDGGFILEPQYAALRLNFYGTDETVRKIEVTEIDTTNPSYTLDCGTEGVTVGTTVETATPFIIVVPAGNIKFSAEVYNNASTPVSIDKFNMKESQSISAGCVLNMSAKEIGETGKRGKLNGQDYVIIKAKYDGTNYSCLKWATCNIGATTPQGYGTYFAWGDVTGQTRSGSTWSGGGFSTAPSYEVDAKGNLKPEYDAAHKKLGGSWRMPTGGSAGEFMAMKNATNWTWNDTYHGFYVTKSGETLASDKSNALLFFPAAGNGNGTNHNGATDFGHYWSSTLGSDNAYTLSFQKSNITPESSYSRHLGFSVRPVSN